MQRVIKNPLGKTRNYDRRVISFLERSRLEATFLGMEAPGLLIRSLSSTGSGPSARLTLFLAFLL